MLGDTSVIRFYPSKFVLVTEILDTFGRLVYNRILDRAGAKSDLDNQIHSPEQFEKIRDSISPQAIETVSLYYFFLEKI